MIFELKTKNLRIRSDYLLSLGLNFLQIFWDISFSIENVGKILIETNCLIFGFE